MKSWGKFGTDNKYRDSSSVDGISAVNPQAKGSYDQYIDASFQNAKQRLDPIMGQQRRQYEQSMVNRGIPVGSQGYNSAFQQLDQNQNDAYSSAAFDAMGFGLGAQAQDFGQDAQRSQLANSLLQARMNQALGFYNADLGYDSLAERGRQFDASLVSDLYKHDTTQDYNYWNQGNAWDLANDQFGFQQDRALQDDYRWAVGQDRQDFYDNREQSRYDDAFMMQLLGMGQGPGVYTQDPTSAYNAQLGSMTNMYGTNMNFLSDMFGSAAAFIPGGG